MKETDDPRIDPNYDECDRYPCFGGGPAPVLLNWGAEK